MFGTKTKKSAYYLADQSEEGNEAVTRLIVGDLYRSQELEITFTYPRTYSLANFIDLNQDGRLEVVVEIQKWEGFGARVFQIDGEDVLPALSAEC